MLSSFSTISCPPWRLVQILSWRSPWCICTSHKRAPRLHRSPNGPQDCPQKAQRWPNTNTEINVSAYTNFLAPRWFQNSSKNESQAEDEGQRREHRATEHKQLKSEARSRHIMSAGGRTTVKSLSIVILQNQRFLFLRVSCPTLICWL